MITSALILLSLLNVSLTFVAPNRRQTYISTFPDHQASSFSFSLDGLVSDIINAEFGVVQDDGADEDGNRLHKVFKQISPLDRDYPDFANLKPDDPLFLDMPWPEKGGPEATAYGKHILWKRRLTDGERMRWQKWAVYKRSMIKDKFDYSLDDYIVQNMIRDIRANALKKGVKEWEGRTWEAIADGMVTQEEDAVRGAILAFYSAFNRRNYDDMRVLWLPDESVELLLPGYEKVV